MFSKLLKIQRQKKDRFKVGKTKSKINDFKLSDDEEENVKPHKVSFLKTKRNSSPVHTEQLDSVRSDSHHGTFHSSQSRSTPQSPGNSVTAEKIQQSDSPFSSQSDKPQLETNVQTDQSESIMRMRNQTEPYVVRKSLSESPLPLNSENSRWESSVPLPSEVSQWDSPVSLLSEKEDNRKISFGEDAEPPIPHPRERSVKPKLPTGEDLKLRYGCSNQHKGFSSRYVICKIKNLYVKQVVLHKTCLPGPCPGRRQTKCGTVIS